MAVLSRVRDPGNAGTVIRAADAAGADAVVLTDESVDVHNPKCVRASAGSVFHLPSRSAPRWPGSSRACAPVGAWSWPPTGARTRWISTTSLDAAQAGDGPLTRPTAWIFGNEAWGLTEDDWRLADLVVRVPIHGAAESLNLATAAAVCLYASARVAAAEQSRRPSRRPPPPPDGQSTVSEPESASLRLESRHGHGGGPGGQDAPGTTMTLSPDELPDGLMVIGADALHLQFNRQRADHRSEGRGRVGADVRECCHCRTAKATTGGRPPIRGVGCPPGRASASGCC